jgi:hypothetical protein
MPIKMVGRGKSRPVVAGAILRVRFDPGADKGPEHRTATRIPLFDPML